MIDMYNLCLMVINRQTFDLYYQSMKYRSPAHSKELIVVLFPLTAFVSSRISFRIKMSSYFAGIFHFDGWVLMFVKGTADATNVVSRVGKTTCWIARIEFAIMMCVGLCSESGWYQECWYCHC